MKLINHKASVRSAWTTILLGVAALVAISVSFARMKLAIFTFGPEAVGVLGYLLSISTFATIFFSFGLSISSNTLINRDRSILQKQAILYWSAGGAIISIVFFQLTFQLFSFADMLTEFRPNRNLFSLVIVLFIVTGVAGSIAAGRLSSGKLSLFRIVSSCIAFSAIVYSYFSPVGPNSLLLFWSAVPIGTIGAIFLLFRSGALKELRSLAPLAPQVTVSVTKTTIATSFSLMVTATFVAASHIFLRDEILAHAGVIALSEFQVGWSLSMAVFSLLSATINSTFLAEISRKTDDDSALANTYKKYVIVLLVISIPGYLMLYVFAQPIIMFLFSSDFQEAQYILRTMILGDLIKVMVAPAALVIMVKSKTSYVLIEIFSAAAFILIALHLLENSGQITTVADGYFYSYILNAIVYFCLWKLIFSGFMASMRR